MNTSRIKECNEVDLIRLSEEESCKFFVQLIGAVGYLHSIGCAHRDVKPSNILLDRKLNIKVIDFGLGNLYDEKQKLNTACGSPCYAAPEIISGESYDPMKVDIWSSGITLYAMLCGSLPFDEESKSVLYDKILACKFNIPKHVSAQASDLLRKMLIRDPLKRPHVDEILRHPWVQMHNSNKVSMDSVLLSSVDSFNVGNNQQSNL